jgi:ribosome-binding protein aMBF1 (putative translation factor)
LASFFLSFLFGGIFTTKVKEKEQEVSIDPEPPELISRIAGQIRRWRRARRMTQKELSLAIFASESYIATIENVPRCPSFLLGMRIVRVLGLEPEDLLKPLTEVLESDRKEKEDGEV